MKIKAGELKSMHNRAEKVRLRLLSLERCKEEDKDDELYIDEDLQDDTAFALQEYEDLLSKLIDAAEITI